MIDNSPDRYAWKPLPVGVLPPPVRDFVRDGAEALGCDTSFLALPVLASLGAAIGNTRRLRLKRTWAEHPIVWAAIVGGSGTMKTPAMRTALGHLHHYQANAFRRYEQERGEHESAVLQHEQRLAEWRKTGSKLGSEPPQAPAPPVAERLVVSDITTEALAVRLVEQPRGLLVARDELSGWIGSFGAYKQGRGGDAARWLELWQAGTLVVDRKGGEPIHVPRASVSIVGGIQPDTLAMSLGREHFENGLAARLLLARPPRQVKRWTDNELAPEVDNAFGDVLRGLLDLQFELNMHGDPVPVDVPLSDAARPVWVRFVNQHAEEQAGLNGDLASAWSKLEAYCARFALIDHLVRVASGDREVKDPGAVGSVSIICAMQLVRWFGEEAMRIYAGMCESEDQKAANAIVEMAKARGGELTVKELQRNRAKYKTAQDAREELRSLAHLGFGRFVVRAAGPKGGRPSEVFELGEQYRTDETYDHPRLNGHSEALVGCVDGRLGEESERGPWEIKDDDDV